MIDFQIPSYFTRAEDEPHKSRCRDILKAHPEVSTLIGRNPWTGAVLAGLLSLQLGLAFWLGSLGIRYWWLSLIIAWCVGAFASHCMYVIIHEATHNLIFRSKFLNKVAGVAADLTNTFPGALAFRVYHLKHHAHMGEHDWDGDLPLPWEARLVKNSSWRKIIWMFLFPFMQVTRSMFTKKVKTINTWVVINLVAVVLFDIFIIYFFGFNAIIYCLFSMVFGLGLHPVGARWIQEHFTLDENQETYSYYGWLNNLSMNVGYHNEHHDFPSIPWNRLPELRAMAPEYYDTLAYHDSWSKLLLKFLFSPEYSLYSRITHVDSLK